MIHSQTTTPKQTHKPQLKTIGIGVHDHKRSFHPYPLASGTRTIRHMVIIAFQSSLTVIIWCSKKTQVYIPLKKKDIPVTNTLLRTLFHTTTTTIICRHQPTTTTSTCSNKNPGAECNSENFVSLFSSFVCCSLSLSQAGRRSR